MSKTTQSFNLSWLSGPDGICALICCESDEPLFQIRQFFLFIPLVIFSASCFLAKAVPSTLSCGVKYMCNRAVWMCNCVVHCCQSLLLCPRFFVHSSAQVFLRTSSVNTRLSVSAGPLVGSYDDVSLQNFLRPFFCSMLNGIRSMLYLTAECKIGQLAVARILTLKRFGVLHSAC